MDDWMNGYVNICVKELKKRMKEREKKEMEDR